MNVVFMGTPTIAREVLETIFNINNVKIVGVVCQPDRMLDRKKNLVFSPVKDFCLKKQLLCFQPEKISEITTDLQNLHIDIIITCAYGQFIPQTILDIPTIGCFNLHASLLPQLRGGAPIHWAIINGLKTTGITLMKMVKKMDAGDIIWQSHCTITDFDTTKSLTIKLTKLACELIMKKWNDLCSKKYTPIKQNEALVTFGLNITKTETIINFHQSVQLVDQWIRGLYDKPLAIWKYHDLNIKIYHAIPTTIKSLKTPGEISKLDKSGLYIATLDYDLKITKLQLPNKNPVEVSMLINGHHPFN